MTAVDEQLHDRFLRLFTTSEPAIRAFVRRLVPLRQDAQDVMQEIALVLWRKFGTYPQGDDFRRWAFGVARYEILAWLRDKTRDRHMLAGEIVELLADESVEADQRLELQREALRACLDKLPEEQRRLVMAAYEPGARMQEVAALSGRTVAAFYQWLHRVRVLLLNCVRRAVAKEDCP
jgi:RNA polymerase sigma-70 factor (ECF subfamily)